MSIESLGYKEWEGQKHGRFYKVLSLVDYEVRHAWSSIWVKILIIIAWLPVLIIFLVPVTEISEEGVDRAFYNLVSFTTSITIWLPIMAGLIGGGLIANDKNNKMFSMYFSRPLRREDYIAGKVGGFAVLMSIPTIVPALIIYIVLIGKSDLSLLVFIKKSWLLGAAWLYFILLIALFGSLVLFLSSVVTDSKYAVVGLFTIVILSDLIANLLWLASDNEIYRLGSLTFNLENILAEFLGIDQSTLQLADQQNGGVGGLVSAWKSLVVIVGITSFMSVLTLLRLLSLEEE
ncbi:MAG: ABC transporter permease [Candidatus Wukongarchaeota archaeon]|nr:ABC transporter permease subunit [Candidatus Wukongarchaeota archaeon]MDO8128868.1 ABC transporter permease subunit [Candidatus Wukongarchaeota archaeon]